METAAMPAPPKPPGHRIRPAFAWLAFGLGCFAGDPVLPTVAFPPLVFPGNTDRAMSGEALAKVYCAACHLFPDPDLLDRKTWSQHTLGRMRFRMGLSPESQGRYPDAALIQASGVIPTAPICTETEFQSIAAYYLTNAPATPLPQGPRPPITRDLSRFTVVKPTFRHEPPSTTLVHISKSRKRIYIGDAEAETLDVLESDGALVESIPVGNTPVALTETVRGAYVTMIGSFMPSEAKLGALTLLERTDRSFRPAKTIFRQTPRMTHAEYADLNHDGRVDIAACFFGYFTGRFSWFESLGAEQFKEHILFEKPGAIRSVARDFNGDGFRDLAVLMAQETEAIFLYLNDGHGNFTQKVVFQTPPIYGHTGFEAVDFDGDDRLDFLVTNGDNGEYLSPTKRYHGIRLYRDIGGNQYREAFFYPLNGAYKAVARDFDGDGDLDIAAISFFPDYEKSPEEAFVYLENLGNFKFKASTFPGFDSGRWLTMDAADIDGDGDIDMVLGSYIRGPSDVPKKLAETWEATGPSILILRNDTRTAPR